MTRGHHPMGRSRSILARALAGIAVACALILASIQPAKAFDFSGSYSAQLNGNTFNQLISMGQIASGVGFYGNSSYFDAELVLNANGTSTFNYDVIDLSGLDSGFDGGSVAGPDTETGAMTIYAGVTIDLSQQSSGETISWGFTTSVDGTWDSGSGYTEGDYVYFSDDDLDFTVATYGTTTLAIHGSANFNDAPTSIFGMTFEFVVPY